MPLEITVPPVGESVTEARINAWYKKPGEQVQEDEPLAELDTDKASVVIPAPKSGVLVQILKQPGETVNVGDVIALFEPGEAVAAAAPAETPAAAKSAPAAPAGASKVMPAAERVLAEANLPATAASATGPGGRVLKEDALRAVQQAAASPATAPAAAAPATAPAAPSSGGSREEEHVPMSLLRKKIAERLVKAQQTAALLTTFNEIDMTAVMELRKLHQDEFTKRYGIKLGFMSFFVKAVCDALRLVPAINAEIRGETIVYRNYADIGVAVGGGKGLVVPVLRNAERLSFAEVEKAIADFGTRAKNNAVTPDEMAGGTFTISNGGVYGSLLSTPIVNPPQSGILGLHAIKDRAVVINGQVVARPMMYVALTYDHRIVDGREGVTFLKRIKECIEDPTRILMEV